MEELYSIYEISNGQTNAEGINSNFTKIANAVDNIKSNVGVMLDTEKKDDTNIRYSTEYGNIVNDVKVTSSKCLLTSPIRVTKGDVVKVNCCQFYDGAVISTTNAAGTSFTHKVMGDERTATINDATPTAYSYTAEADGYVVIGWYKSKGVQIAINRVMSNIINELDERVTDIEDKLVFGSPTIYLSGDTGDVDLTAKTIDELYAAYDALVIAHPQMITKDTDLGMDASNTYAIRQYTIAMNSPYQINGEYFDSDLPESNPWNVNYNNKKIVAVAAGCHGNEKNVAWGVYLAIKELLESSEQWATYIKANFVIKLLPCMNPWGFENTSRYNSNNKDINRDIIDQTQSESVAWKSFIDNNKDNMVLYLDMHGTRGRCGYFEVLADDQYYGEYCRAYYKFISAIHANYSTYMPNAYPYIYLCESTYSGMTMNYTKALGIKGHIMETTSSYQMTVLSSKWCKMTKDELINGIMLYAKP